MKNLHYCTILLVVLGVNLVLLQDTYAQSRKQRVEHFLTQAMVKERIPGLAYAILEDNKIAMKGTLGMADLSWNQPVSTITAFQLASVSKIYTGALLARLFSKGIFSPESKLENLIDSIPDNWKNITLLQLATHQSGIQIGNFGEAKDGKEAFEIAKKQPFQFAPGDSENYVSSDYWILQYVIENKMGKPYFEVLKEYITTPLGMGHTFVDYWRGGHVLFSEIIPQKATIYHAASDPERYIEGIFPFVSTGYAAGGIYTSLDDMITLQRALHDTSFIEIKYAKLIFSAQPLKSKMGTFGLGTMVYNYDGHPVVGHSGGPALADVCYFEKEGITVIILTNQRGFYPYLAKSVASFFIPGLKMEVPPSR
ncbi:serine hydrolase domain-containing protein [Sphingobacterium thalpophilum]|uniref:serine hydrolase domain-containing protein n=1 Tax=Sphingobacterium thalpophilum TaxID=259 RepID=UPI003DA356DE